MDTTYINTILVVFLVVAALAIDIGYMYVSEEDLQSAAETSALTGAQVIDQRIRDQLRSDPKKVGAIMGDTVQTAARTAATDLASGKHKSAALVHVNNNNTNRLTTENDLTVGNWNPATHAYTPGGTPVNAMQVRTRRTAESESVGLGSVGSMLAKISGVQKFDYTPEAVSAFPARASASIAFCADVCGTGCTWPNVCTIPERRMVREPQDPDGGVSGPDRYAFTTLLHQVTGATKLTDLACMELPPQAVCGNRIYTLRDRDDATLRDMESMMYNPNIDKANKEFDKGGNVTAWWLIAPVTDCPVAREENVFEQHAVTRYALIRISRICVEGGSGCRQTGTSFKAPATSCSGLQGGLYIDRISCVGCGSQELSAFPGLHPVLVK